MKNLPNDLMKANIDYMLGRSYEPIDENNLLKGEGSKGGKVVGHTKSGRAIYANKRASAYKHFSIAEHSDAAGIHKELSKQYESKGDKKNSNHHAVLARTHQNVY